MRRPQLPALPEGSGPRVLLGRQLSRHTAVYAAGTVGALPIFLLNAIVLTNFLSPAEYGDVGVLFVVAAFMSVFENLVTLNGTLGYVYGASEDDDVDDEVATQARRDPRRAMTTGLITTLVVIGVVSIAPLVFASTIAGWLIGDSELGDAVIWMTVSAGAGALWRLVGAIPRMERRPAQFALFNIGRGVVVLALTIPLLAAGGGVEAPLVGTAVGTLLLTFGALVSLRHVFRPAFARSDLRGIGNEGRRTVPFILAVTVTSSADVLLLSRLTSAADVGLYRLASRFANVASYAVSSFMLSWGPLRRTSVFRAAYDEGKAQTNSRLVTYYVLATLALAVGLGVTADVLVELAPPSYADAAPLIPIIALGIAAHGGIRVLSRTARFPRKQAWYLGALIGGALLTIGLSILLIPPLGGYGAALALLLSGLLPCGLLVVKIQRSKRPIPFEGRRMLAATVLAVLSLLIALRGDTWSGLPAAPFDLIALVVFGVGLVVTGAIPRRELRPLLSVLRAMLPTRTRETTASNLDRVDSADRQLLELLFRHRLSPQAISDATGSEPDEIQRRAVAALRRLADVGPPNPHDAELGAYLVSEQWLAERDPMARALWDRDDAISMHRLELLVEQLRRLPAASWAPTGGR